MMVVLITCTFAGEGAAIFRGCQMSLKGAKIFERVCVPLHPQKIHP